MLFRSAAMSVSDIFVTEGEAAFRTRERAAVVDALHADGVVVSLGGGAVINADTRADLRGHKVAWLQVSLSDAATRAGLNQARPLLLGNVRATLAHLLDERTPWYAEVASQTFDTSVNEPSQVAAQVLQWLDQVEKSEHDNPSSITPTSVADTPTGPTL